MKLSEISVGDEFAWAATISVRAVRDDRAGYYKKGDEISTGVTARAVVTRVGVRREIFDGWRRRKSTVADGVVLDLWHEDEKIGETTVQARKLDRTWADYHAAESARIERNRKRQRRIEVERARVGDLAERLTALLGDLRRLTGEGHASERVELRHSDRWGETYAEISSIKVGFDSIEELRDLVEMAEQGVRLRNLDQSLLDALLAEGDE